MGKKKVMRIKNRKRFWSAVLAAVLLLSIFCALLYFNHLNSASKALDPGNTEQIVVNITNGTSTEQIGAILLKSGIIGDENVFVMKAKLDNNDGKFKAGNYRFSPSMSMDEIMALLLKGEEDTLRFTIPEGYDIKKTITVLSKDNLIDPDAFRNEISSGKFDYRFLSDLPSGENRLEGYLFPETYEVFANASEHAIIDKMLSQFNKVFTDKYYARAKELGMSVNEVITLASIIEREAAVESDRPVIAGVFYNRLKAGMPLQSCATVQYILGDQKAVLSIADTKIQSPYNTYLNKGLPPGPICSPGLASIKAALWPTKSDYLYFLAKGDGTHVFAKTYAEHLKNKAKYIDSK